MRIVITGGAGFIGSHVADAAIRRGHEVLVLDDLTTGHRTNVPEEALFNHLDIRNGAAVRRALGRFQPDVVCHQAAQTSVSLSTKEPGRDADVNVLGSLEILEAAVACGVERVVFASTGGAIYGEVPDGVRASERTPERPLSPYACSKLAVERYLACYEHAAGLRYNILRYANVYGPRQDPHGEAGVVAIFAERLLKNVEIQINARATLGDEGCVRDYVYVEDVVRANLAAIEGRVPTPVMNVCSGFETTTRELADQLAALTGSRSRVTSAPQRDGDLERSVLDPSESRWLGEPTPLPKGLARTVDWFRERARHEPLDTSVVSCHA